MDNYHQLSDMLAEAAELQARVLALKPLPKEEQSRHGLQAILDLTHSNNSMEGGSLCEEDVRTILCDKMAVGGKSLREHLEALGYAKGMEHVLELSRPPFGNGPTAPERTIKRLHKLCSDTMAGGGAGSYRKRRVLGARRPCPKPQELPGLMDDFAARQAEQNKRLHPLQYAAWLHHRFLEISPFAENNGAVARLLLNLALMRRKHLPTPIPGHLLGAYQASLTAPSENSQAFACLLCLCHIEAQKRYLALRAGSD